MAVVGILSTFRDRVIAKVGAVQSPELAASEDVLDICVDAGVNQYSRLRPRTVVVDVPGDGTTRRYVLNTVLTLWDPSFSNIAKVAMVQNTDLDNEIETVFTDRQLTQRKDSGGNDVMFITDTVAVGKDIRFEFTALHTIHIATANLTTIPASDTSLLTALTASYVAGWIARKASDLSNVQLGTTEIDYGRLRSHWSTRASELLKEASEMIDPRVMSHESTGVAVEWKSQSSFAPRRISH